MNTLGFYRPRVESPTDSENLNTALDYLEANPTQVVFNARNSHAKAVDLEGDNADYVRILPVLNRYHLASSRNIVTAEAATLHTPTETRIVTHTETRDKIIEIPRRFGRNKQETVQEEVEVNKRINVRTQVPTLGNTDQLDDAKQITYYFSNREGVSHRSLEHLDAHVNSYPLAMSIQLPEELAHTLWEISVNNPHVIREVAVSGLAAARHNRLNNGGRYPDKFYIPPYKKLPKDWSIVFDNDPSNLSEATHVHRPIGNRLTIPYNALEHLNIT